ncbi:MAG: polymerase, sigma 28 subunit, SigI [Clostridiales bacterium]|jgi:RNA polymerase sigma factor|nr:polymerase, sigma 28 subunit, SigI [Clostridiales bacterium]
MYAVSINERVENIKNQENEINRLVEEYKPFIASSVQEMTGRYVRYGEDDELSIAMMAFVEAIKSYDSNKGNFLAFSKNVIKRRLIDYYRKENRHNNVISIHEYMQESEEDSQEADLTREEALRKYSEDEISEYRRLELEQLKKELSVWDISFFELVDVSPKAEKTRKAYGDILKYLLSQQDMIRLIKTKKYLPVAEIEKNTRIPRKTIERARKYILAVLIIYTGDYQYISDYINI